MPFDPSLLVRAEDYWREDLREKIRDNIGKYNSQRNQMAKDCFYSFDVHKTTSDASEQIDSEIVDWWGKGYSQYDEIKAASNLKTIPESFFDTHEDNENCSPVPPGDWFFSVKEDGYLEQ
jgi:hypothetical protein